MAYSTCSSSVCAPVSRLCSAEAGHLLVCEPFLRVRELAEFMPHHVLRHGHWQIVLSVVHHKLDSTST